MNYLPLALILSQSKERRSKVAETLLPVMLPGAATQRVALGAVLADQQVRNAERREENILKEVSSAIETSTTNGGELTAEQENALPKLAELLRRRPELRDRIRAAASSIVQHQQDTLGASAIRLIVTALNHPEKVQDLVQKDVVLSAVLARNQSLQNSLNNELQVALPMATSGKVATPSTTDGGSTELAPSGTEGIREK